MPDASDTYTYLIDGCQPDHEENGERSAIQWQDVDFVKFSGCWEIEDIEDVYASSGTVELVAPGYVRVSGISDADLPLTVEILFHDSLKSGDERTWIWIHTGPADNDGWTQIVGGPFCDGSTPTPTDPPTPTPTKPPTPTPTEPPTPTPTEPPTPTPSPTPVTKLTIVKTDSPDPVAANGTLAYTVTVNNIGTITAFDVVVMDDLPGDVSLISSTPGQGSCSGTTCELGDIAAGAAVAISYVVRVNDDAASPLLNTACVTSGDEDPTATDNCDDEDTRLETPLAETSPPNGLPPTGGSSFGGGTPSLWLLLLLGAALAVSGTIAGFAARRHVTNG